MSWLCGALDKSRYLCWLSKGSPWWQRQAAGARRLLDGRAARTVARAPGKRRALGCAWQALQSASLLELEPRRCLAPHENRNGAEPRARSVPRPPGTARALGRDRRWQASRLCSLEGALRRPVVRRKDAADVVGDDRRPPATRVTRRRLPATRARPAGAAPSLGAQLRIRAPPRPSTPRAAAAAR